MKKINPAGCFVVLGCAVVIGIIIAPSVVKVMNERTVTVTVTDKAVKRGSGKSAKDCYMIFTDDTTYEITDSLLKWRFDSSDLYGTIEVGQTYEMDVAGFRVPFISAYPNIYSVKIVEGEE